MKSITIRLKADEIIITADSRVHCFPKFKGFIQIAELLANPDYEVSCLSLQTDDVAGIWEAEERLSKFKTVRADDHDPIDEYHSLDCYYDYRIMDSRYFNEVKIEIKRLEREVKTADDHNDIARKEQKQAELQELKWFLYQNLKKPRYAPGRMPGEFTKSLDAVKKNYLKALQMIAAEDPELADYFRKHIRIWKYCCYLSLPSVDIRVIYEA